MTAVKKILNTPLRISIVILLLGLLAKMFQWPYAIGVVFFGFLAIGILYAIRFWRKSTRQYVDYVKLILVIFWTTNGILRILDFPYTLFFQIMTGITFVLWFIMEGTAYFLDEDRRAKNSLSQIVWNCILVVGTLAIISGSLLKILNWTYALPLLGFGILLIVAYITKDLFIGNKSIKDENANEELTL